MVRTTAAKTVTVHEVVYHAQDKGPGPCGDGSFIQRFGKERLGEAEAFAKKHVYYGKVCQVQTNQVPVRIAKRWGFA